MVLATSQQEFSDADFRVVDNGDQSKKLAFEVSGLTTGTTRTWTVPDANVTVSAFGATLIDDADAAAARTTLGLGTAATKDTGASGGTIPLLNAANTWSATQQFNAAVNIGNFTLSLGTFSATGASRGYANTNGVMQQSVEFTSTALLQRFYNPNGLIGQISCAGSTTSYTTSSDERLKENFTDFDPGELIDAMSFYRYEWKVDGAVGWGPKAQELYQVFPTAVSPGSEGDAPGDETFEPWGFDASKLVPLLVREIQLLRARVAALESSNKT